MTFIGCLLGYILIGDLNVYEQNLLGNLFELIGQVLLTNAASTALIQGKVNNTLVNINDPRIKEIYDPIIYDIDKLRKFLKEINPQTKDETLNTLLNSLEKIQKEIKEIKKEA